MKNRDKITILVLFGVLALVIAGFLIWPKASESFEKTAELTARKSDLQQLQAKMSQTSKAEQDRRLLEKQIETLRNSVPKSAELDLMVLDMEKMASTCHVDLVAVETPSQDVMRELQTAADEQAKANAPKEVASTKPRAAAKPANPVQEAALKNVVKQVFITGDYGGLVSFTKMLESYQRVVGVSKVAIAVHNADSEGERNPASERADRLKLKQPLMSFLLTLYYLP